MVLKKIKFVKHANKLVSAVSALYDKPGEYSDLEVHIGTATFRCHKLILALQSTYFQQCLFFPGELNTMVFDITLDDILPDDFQCLLSYLYTGEIELDTNTVAGFLRVADLVQLYDLKQLCLQFMKETLGGDTCVEYWKATGDVGDTDFQLRCLECFSKEFTRVKGTCHLQDITYDMMKEALERDDLNVKNEVEVCEMLLSWFDANQRSLKAGHRYQLLSRVRWSAVNIEYIKANLINKELLINDKECFEFLSVVISYRLSGIQFADLRTHHRKSTELETSVVIFGVDNGPTMTSECYRVSLQSKERVTDIANVPTAMEMEVPACVNNGLVYVCGLGSNNNESWRWDSTGGWTRCADMNQGRRRHCATFVNNTSMYVLGGWVDSTKTTLSSVEQFNTMRNKWTQVGQLANCTQSAGCVTYKTSIYLFGGSHRDQSTNKYVDLDCIQEYNTSTEQCTVLTQRLPQPRRLLRAVLWDKSVILLHNLTCLIFDFDQKTIQQRDQFAVGISQFGLVLDNRTLFVLGGGTAQTDSNGKLTWTCSDEVKSIPVMDIVNNKQTVNWTQHAKLKSPQVVFTWAFITLPKA